MKTAVWVISILAALLLITMVVMVVMKNKKPSFNIENVSGGVAKIKVARKTYDYVLNANGTILSIGSGRYTVIVSTSLNNDGTPSGVVAQLYDGKTGQKVDAAKVTNA